MKAKKMKKILALILSVSMILSMSVVASAAQTEEVMEGYVAEVQRESDDLWDGVTVNTDWYTESAIEFTLTQPAQLAGLAKLVNDGNDFFGKIIKLGRDIKLDEDGNYEVKEDVTYGAPAYPMTATQYIVKEDANLWTPIGQAVATSNTALNAGYTAFAGTFDGQGHTISGIYTGVTTDMANTATVQGLFGVVSGTVKNVTTSGCITGKAVLGGVAAYLQGGTVENCINRAVVFGDGGTTPNGGKEDGTSRIGAIGGIAGNVMTESAITKCFNYGDIICVNTNKGGRAGGILGMIDASNAEVTLNSSFNAGDVYAYQYAGGIAGGNWSGKTPIEHCANTGKISGFGSGSTYVGGIVATSSSRISDCYNRGDFGIINNGKAAHAGGIVSDFAAAGAIVNCYNTGNFFCKSSLSSSSSMGGICGTGYGTAAASRLTNCYTISNHETNPFEDAREGCAAVMESEDMRTEEFLQALNGAGGAFVADSRTNPINDGYPILAFQHTDGESTEETDWSQVNFFEAGKTYYIADAADLAAMSTLVNSGYSGADATFVLTKDVDLSDADDFVPIGTAVIDTSVPGLEKYRLGMPFAGTFDGRGYMISQLNLEDNDGGIALFTYSVGNIQNLTVQGSVKGNSFTAGVVALGSGKIENVTNQVTVTASGNYVGGILADAVGDVEIRSCHNQAQITNGEVASERGAGRIAGIVGRIESGHQAVIRECSNTANVTGYQYVAGIVGGSFGNVSIDACYNSGKITGISFGKVYLGGIAGKLEKGTISNCYNSGSIYNAHWSAGHIRAVGGIAGSEENHSTGTAITNCYNAGEMTFNTTNMTPGINYIYMVGNISGGNNSTASNTMHYDNCFYLKDSLTIADTSHEGYLLWSDVYKDNPLAYDTSDIIGCTAEELSGDEVLTSLGSSFRAGQIEINSGYPTLYWQTGGGMPAITSSIDVRLIGGNAEVKTAAAAEAGVEVDIDIVNIEEGKQLKSVTAVDASGESLFIARTDEGHYYFTMPARSVTITVTLENAIAFGQDYMLSLPTVLDPIWTLDVDSGYYDDGRVTEGATVVITVSKQQGAATSSFTGVSVQEDNGEERTVEVTESDVQMVNDARTYAKYTFTMPDFDVAVTLEETYRDFIVYHQNPDESPTAAKIYTRTDMHKLAQTNPIYYSGWSSETQAFIGRADIGISLLDILEDADLTFGEGDRLMVTSADGMTLTYDYSKLMGTKRCYYSDIFDQGNGAEQGLEIPPMFVLKGNVALNNNELESMISDTLNTYRFVFGQSEAELRENVKCVDIMPKGVTAITLIKADAGESVVSGYTVSLHLAKNQLKAGEVFDVDVRLAGEDDFASFQADVSYDEQLIEFVSAEGIDSSVRATAGNGAVRILRVGQNITVEPSGVLVAKLTFRAKPMPEAGTHQANFSVNNALAGKQNQVNENDLPAAVGAPQTITVRSSIAGEVEFISSQDYNAAPMGYQVLLFKPTVEVQGARYCFDSTESNMFWSDKYERYVYFVKEEETQDSVLSKISITYSGENQVIQYSGDVNGSSFVNIYDAQIVYDLYADKAAANGMRYLADSEFSALSMLIRLEADVNGDRVVDIQDVRIIGDIILADR